MQAAVLMWPAFRFRRLSTCRQVRTSPSTVMCSITLAGEYLAHAHITVRVGFFPMLHPWNFCFNYVLLARACATVLQARALGRFKQLRAHGATRADILTIFSAPSRFFVAAVFGSSMLQFYKNSSSMLACQMMGGGWALLV
eukprot:6182744-Pleurochrysis_carterae.AAC.1